METTLLNQNKILIYNHAAWHYEIIESIILKYDKLIDINKREDDQICLFTFSDQKFGMISNVYPSFIKYLKEKYPNIIVYKNLEEVTKNNFTHIIHATAQKSSAPEAVNGTRPKDFVKSKKFAYISHDICDEMKDYDNVYFLCNLNNTVTSNGILEATDLPFKDKKTKTKVPTFIIQGSIFRMFDNKTRNLEDLSEVFNVDTNLDYKIKIVGSSRDSKDVVLQKIEKHIKNKKNLNNIEIKINLDWNDFHKEFLECDFIYPLISKKNQPEYFDSKITSSYNYGRAYGLKFFIDQDFKNAYSIKDDDCFIYNSKNIKDAFIKCLESWYKKNE